MLERTYCSRLAERVGIPEADVVQMWSERAAVLEYDGGYTRSQAEAQAFTDIERELLARR